MCRNRCWGFALDSCALRRGPSDSVLIMRPSLPIKEGVRNISLDKESDRSTQCVWVTRADWREPSAYHTNLISHHLMGRATATVLSRNVGNQRYSDAASCPLTLTLLTWRIGCANNASKW